MRYKKLAILFLWGVIGFELWETVDYYRQLEKDKKVYSYLREQMLHQQSTGLPEEENLEVDLQELRRLNLETVGWLEIKATDIAYPIVQGVDNNYYLNHDFNGNEAKSGCIFMDYRNSPLFTDQNTILYGHNMKNNTMFGSLEDHKAELIDYEKVIYVNTGDDILVYDIFAIYNCPASFDYREISYAEGIQSFLDKAKAYGGLWEEMAVTNQDKILTLSTCQKDQRLVVHAKQVEIKHKSK